MRNTKRIFFIVMLLQILSTTFFAQRNAYARDLVLITDWFEGEFDNDSQIWFESRTEGYETEDRQHHRMHVVHQRIEQPEVGKYVFRILEYMDDDTTKIFDEWYAVFSSQAADHGIRLKRYELQEGSEAIDITDSPCEVLFKREGDQFHGMPVQSDCQQFKMAETTMPHEVIISKTKYWRAGKYEPYKLRKVKQYICEIKFFEKSYMEPSPNDVVYKDIKVHNQGGYAWVNYPKENKKYGLQLREKEYPFYEEGADFFMLRFIQEGQKSSDLLLTAEPGIKKISFNIRWASAQCYLQE